MLLNADFVAIKVDREERPDVDRVYMAFVQSTTGSGGWPMTVFLTPELKPFFGGTYFPPSSRWGRPGFLDVLGELTRVWKRGSRARGLRGRRALRSAAGDDRDRRRSQAETTLAGTDALTEAVEQFAADVRSAPRRLRRRAEISAPVRAAVPAARARRGRARTPALTMATETLRAMALGGMRDHVGGGFHRYSVDAEWRVPHFEKMLYDQAQLVLAYLEAGQAARRRVLLRGRGRHAGLRAARSRDAAGRLLFGRGRGQPRARIGDHKARRRVLRLVRRGDRALLGDDADVVRQRFGIEPDGNAPRIRRESSPARTCSTPRSRSRTSRCAGQAAEDDRRDARAARDRAVRCARTRPRPHLDDKVITSWNGLMIAAFARAARVLRRASATRRVWLDTARGAAQLHPAAPLGRVGRRLLRRYRDGEAGDRRLRRGLRLSDLGPARAVSGRRRSATWLAWARRAAGSQDELFWDEDDAGWFSTTGRDPSVLLRLKEDYDGAEPSASSVSVLNVLTLAHLTDDAAARAKAERTLARYGPRAGRAARVIPLMLAGLSAWHAGASQIVLVGSARS